MDHLVQSVGQVLKPSVSVLLGLNVTRLVLYRINPLTAGAAYIRVFIFY